MARHLGKEILSAGIAHINVGEEMTPFDVHVELLCDCSPFFDNLYKERSSSKISSDPILLPDEDPDVFAEVVVWMYQGNLSHDLSSRVRLLFLFRLWVLACKLEIPQLQNAAISVCKTIIDNKPRAVPSLEVLNFVFTHTAAGSPPRKFIVDTWGQRVTMERYSTYREAFPHEFLDDLCGALIRTIEGTGRSEFGESQSAESYYVQPPSVQDSIEEQAPSSRKHGGPLLASPSQMASRKIKSPSPRLFVFSGSPTPDAMTSASVEAHAKTNTTLTDKIRMAYYGWSFTLSDPSCTEPGCPYRSGGNAGTCSETIGFLLNSEIQDTVESLGLTPTLYKDAAVKAVAFGDQWVSYDDEETFKIRGDYVRSHCMGGVMVWAISHDNRDYTSAKALTSGLGRKRMDFPNYPETPDSSSAEKRAESSATCSGASCGKKYQEDVVQACDWTNCGDDCPTGWKWIDRQDSGLKMTDDTACPPSVGDRKFCCPGDSALPTCRWRGMPAHGGFCTPGCEDGEVEVGTLASSCDWNHQSACCTTTKSTEPYGQCKWVGISPFCAAAGKVAACPSDYPIYVFNSSNGAGGEKTCSRGAKSLCCKGEVPWQFQTCKWHSKATHKIGFQWYCESSCPDGETRLGMHKGDCADGWKAYCCAGNPPKVEDDAGAPVERRDPDQHNYYEYEFLIDNYMEDPGAPTGYQSPSWGGLARRATEYVKRSIFEMQSFDRLNTLTARTVVSLLSMTVSLWNRRGPATEFGSSYLAQEMNQMVFYARNESEAYGYVSDMNAFPEVGHEGTLRLRAAEEDLCELVEDDSTEAKRELPAFNGTRIIEGRHVNVIGGHGAVFLLGEPSIEDILRGILDGDLVLHYARWDHFGDLQRDRTQGPDAGPMLELAYWIGTRVGERGYNAGLYQNDPSDRWVVFHIHTLSDRHAFHDGPEGTPTNNPFMGVTNIQVYHGQRLETNNERDRDIRVYNRDRRLHADGTYAGNTRNNALLCLDRQRWWVGNAAVIPPEHEHTYAALLQDWGRSLHDQRYQGQQGYQVLYNYFGNQRADATRYRRNGQRMARNFIVEHRAPNGEELIEVRFIRDATLQPP